MATGIKQPEKGEEYGVKCAKPGPVTRNPYLNFLREFRTCQCGMAMTEITRQGAKVWNCMSQSQKSKYIKQACSAPRRKYKKRQRRKSKAKSRSGLERMAIC